MQKQLFGVFLQNWSRLFKIVITILLLYALYWQLFQRKEIDEIWQTFQQERSLRPIPYLLLVLSLMPVNWGIEALKWQTLVRSLENIPWRKAFKGVMCGISLSLFTPNRIGDFGGRILVLKDENKAAAIALTLVGNLSQILATSLLGSIGLLFFITHYMTLDALVIYWTAFSCLIINLVGLLLYYNLGIIPIFLEKWSFFKKYIHHVKPSMHLSGKTLTSLLVLSMLRYGVFSFQFACLLYLFGIQLGIVDGFSMLSSIYLVQTAIPSIAISQLSINGNVLLYFLDPVSQNDLGILTAGFLQWIINLALPALIGLVFLLKLNIFNNK